MMVIWSFNFVQLVPCINTALKMFSQFLLTFKNMKTVVQMFSYSCIILHHCQRGLV